MAHEIDTSNGRNNMAFVGELPWHGLGTALKENSNLEDWVTAAGFNWEAKLSPVTFYPNATVENGTPILGDSTIVNNQLCVYRSDTKMPLSIMTEKYRLMQPRQVMEFFCNVTEAGKLKMETAGMLKGGAIYWAMARINDQFTVGKDDPILPYVLMATSCDGSLSTTVGFNSIRVVCANTLSMAINQKRSSNVQIKVPHNSLFDETRVKAELGLVEGQWDLFKRTSMELSKRKISQKELIQFMMEVFIPENTQKGFSLLETDEILRKVPNVKKCIDLFSDGVGQNTKSAKGTAWGALNAVTRHIDHEVKSISTDSKLRSVWFGSGSRLKKRALQLANNLLEVNS